VVLSTASFAVHAWRSSKRAACISGNSTTIAALECMITMLLCLAFSVLHGGGGLHDLLSGASMLSWGEWARFAGCGMLCTGVPMILELSAMQFMPPATACMIRCTVPVWGFAYAAAFLGDSLGLPSLLAGLAILAFAVGPSALQQRGRRVRNLKPQGELVVA